MSDNNEVIFGCKNINNFVIGVYAELAYLLLSSCINELYINIVSYYTNSVFDHCKWSHDLWCHFKVFYLKIFFR